MHDKGKGYFNSASYKFSIECFNLFKTYMHKYYDLNVMDCDCAAHYRGVIFNERENEMRMYRGLAYLKIGIYDKAIDDLSSVICRDDCAQNYSYRGNAYLECKKYDKAIKDFTKAISKASNKDKSQYHIQRANAYVAKAIDDYNLAIEIETDINCNSEKIIKYTEIKNNYEKLKEIT